MTNLDKLVMRLDELEQRMLDNRKNTNAIEREKEDIKLNGYIAGIYLLINREMEKEGCTYYCRPFPHNWIGKNQAIDMYNYHSRERYYGRMLLARYLENEKNEMEA